MNTQSASPPSPKPATVPLAPSHSHVFMEDLELVVVGPGGSYVLPCITALTQGIYREQMTLEIRTAASAIMAAGGSILQTVSGPIMTTHIILRTSDGGNELASWDYLSGTMVTAKDIKKVVDTYNGEIPHLGNGSTP